MEVPERNRSWTLVDRYAEEHLRGMEDGILRTSLDRALQIAREKGLPSAEVSPLQGKFLALQCQLIQAKNVLEIGTLGAYSTIWLASSSPDVRVTTVEVDAGHATVAKQVINSAGLEHTVDIKLGAANEILPTIRKEVETGSRPPFDLVFIDADKQNNLKYFDEAIRMSRPRACIIVDNVVRDGAVVDPQAAELDGRVKGTREVIEAVGKDGRVLGATVVQTVGVKGYDGFMMAVVR